MKTLMFSPCGILTESMTLYFFFNTHTLLNRFAPFLMMPKSKQDSEKDVRVAGFNITLLKEITTPLFSVVMILILVFMFVTGGDGLIFRICLERGTKKELKRQFKGDEQEDY